MAMLYPFWGKNPESPKDPTFGRYDSYAERGGSFFEMVPLSEADFAVMPGYWQAMCNQSLTEQFIQKAGKAKKPIIVFVWTDMPRDVPIKEAVVFQTASYRSQKKHNEFNMPIWSEDFLSKYLNGRIPVRKKGQRPVVGFCGEWYLADRTFKNKVKEFMLRGVSRIGMCRRYLKWESLTRSEALYFLSKSPSVISNFIFKEQHFGGARLSPSVMDFDLAQKARLEYVQNMVESDYILCVRGSANFCFRLYETLSCGRIPIFIDTDRVLPYDFAVDWKKYCIWIDERELPLIAEKVLEFHENISPQDFINLQYECRNFWQQWVSPEGFFANLYRHFQIES